MINNLFLYFQWYNSYELASVLWIIAFSLLFLSCGLFLLASNRTEVKARKNVLLGYSLFSLSFGFTRFFFFISDFCGDLKDSITTLGYLTGILGIIFIIYMLEKYLIKTRMILTFMTAICFIIMVIAVLGLTTRNVALIMIYILSPAALIAALIAYIYFIINSTGTSRKKAIGALFGIIFIFIGHFLDSSLILSLFPDIPMIISPLVMIFGVIFFTSFQLRN